MTTILKAGLVLGFKLGPKLVAVGIKLLKSAKVVKVGLAAGSLATYSYFWTWEFAVAVVVMLVVHEYGHIRAMKTCGLKTKGIWLIPMMGAAAIATTKWKSRKDEAYIAIMGPVYGTGLSIACMGMWYVTGEGMWGAIAGFGALLNLFNLLPIDPLDGGRIFRSCMMSVHEKLGVFCAAVTLGLLLYGAIWWHIGILWFILVVDMISYAIGFIGRGATHARLGTAMLADWDRAVERSGGSNARTDKWRRDLKWRLWMATVHVKTVGKYELHAHPRGAEDEEIPDDDGKLWRDEPHLEWYYIVRFYMDNTEELPSMTPGEVGRYFLTFFALAVLLFGMMGAMASIPEVQLARSVLIDQPEEE